MNLSRYTVAVSSSILLAQFACTAEPSEAQAKGKPKWMIIRGTESKDGQYAVAWTLRGQPAVWDAVCESYRDKDQRDYEADNKIEIPEGDVENLVVDVKAGKALASLSGKNGLLDSYWEFPHSRPNRHFFEVAWSPNSKFAVVSHTFRWDCVGLVAVQLNPSGDSVVVDISKPLVAAAQKFAKSSPGAADYSTADLNVCFSEPRHVKDTTFHANVDTVAEKSWAANPAQVDFSIVSGKGAPTVKVLRMKNR